MGLDGNFIRSPVRIIPAKQIIGIIKGAFQRAVAMPDGQQSVVFLRKVSAEKGAAAPPAQAAAGAAWSRRKEKMRGAGIAKKLASCNSSSCQWAIKTMRYAFFS